MEIKRISDIGTLMKWRREVIENVFGVVPDEALLAANELYYWHHVPNGSHIAFIVEEDGRECGCGAVCLSEELPSPDNPTGKCAYLMNIYVRKGSRNHGMAHKIVERLILEARKRGCGKIYLESTPEAKPVYTSLGFKDMPDMMKYHEKAD